MAAWRHGGTGSERTQSGECEMIRKAIAGSFVLLTIATTAQGQNQVIAPETSSPNVKLLSHVPLGWQFTTADIEIEQELSRPYVYVQRDFGPAGFNIISLKDPR